MKKIIFTIGFLFILTGIFAQEKNFIDENYIEVAGRAEKEYAPDKISLEITIAEKDSKGKISIETQEKDLFKRFRKIGIDVAKDVQIKDIATSLEKYLLKKNTILMTKSYLVIVNGTPQLISLFEQLEQAGIAKVAITKAELSNYDEAGREVMAQAALNAKRSAEALATVLGRQVDKAIYAQSFASYPRAVYLASSYKGVLDKSLSQEAAGVEETPDFQKIKVEHQVTVRFSLK